MKHTEYCKKNCKDCANRLQPPESDRKYFIKKWFDLYDYCDFDEAYIEKTHTKACHGYRDRAGKDVAK